LTSFVRLNKNQYAADMYHDLIQGLGLTSKAVVPEISFPKRNLDEMEQFLKEAEGKARARGRQRLVIHPGTSRLALEKGIIKTWSPANWANLIERLIATERFTIILAGGPDDETIIGQISEHLRQLVPTPFLISAYGVTRSLADLAAIIQLS